MYSLSHCIVPYLILVANCLLFRVSRKILHYCPYTLRLLLSEIIATLELCADCAELGTYSGYLVLDSIQSNLQDAIGRFSRYKFSHLSRCFTRV